MSKNTKNSTPAFVSFVATLDAAIQAANIPVVRKWDLKDFVGYEFPNQHKVYVPRSSSEMASLHTTIDVLGKDGALELPKGPGSNGKIVSHFVPDLEKVKAVLLPALSNQEDRLRANKKPAKSAASQAPAIQYVGTMDDLTAGLSEDELESI